MRARAALFADQQQLVPRLPHAWVEAPVAMPTLHSRLAAVARANTSGSTNLSGYACGSTNRNFQVLS